MGRGRGTSRCGRAVPEPIGRRGRGMGRGGRAVPEPIDGAWQRYGTVRQS